MAKQNNRPLTIGAIIASFYIVILGTQLSGMLPGAVEPWFIVILLIPVALLIFAPSFLLRYLGHMVGYVILALRRYRQRRRANLHEEESLYEQGYQAVSSARQTQEPATVQELAEPYEAPQAQYPQQQAPM